MTSQLQHKIKRTYYKFGATMSVGMMGLGSSNAMANNSFSTISNNIVKSTTDLPGLVTGTAYLIGMLLSVLGIMKIKDHVENPTQTPLKEGAIRMVAGGALFGLPIITDAMSGSIDPDGAGVAAEVGKVNKVDPNKLFN